MEASVADRTDERTDEEDRQPDPAPETPKKDRTPTEYVALVAQGEASAAFGGGSSEYVPITDSTGEAVKFQAYKKSDVLTDLVEDGQLEADASGKTPWVLVLPSSQFKPMRATVTVPEPSPVVTVDED